MGMQQSKDEFLYQQVNYGNVDGIKLLHSEGAGLEWVDREGKTPLIVACMNPQLYNVANTLIELGANVNAFRPGRQAGTALHHAAKRGLEQTVKLLLSHGANALVLNDDCQTPLDVARAKGFSNVVRAIEAHLCLFSGWLRELYGPGFLELLAPQLLSRKVWVVVLPCGSRNLRKPFKLELAIYAGAQDAQPRTLIPLWKANLGEPNFNLADPIATISDISKIPRRWRRRRAIKSSQEARRTRIKLAPLSVTEIQQLQRFCDACKGIPQALHPLVPFNNQIVPTAPEHAPQTSVTDELHMHETPPHTDSYSGSSSSSLSNEEGYISVPSTSHNPSGKMCEVEEVDTAGNPAQHMQSLHATPSAPLIDAVTDNGPINYPSIDMSSVDLVTGSGDERKEDVSGSSCTICLDAPLEGACVPCGHMAGCMSCLNEIKAKNWGCPVCRAKIDQIIRIYSA